MQAKHHQPQTLHKIQFDIQCTEDYIRQSLNPQLQKLWDRKALVEDQLSKHEQLEMQIKRIMQGQTAIPMQTLVDIGSNFFMQAEVPDTTYIHVNVGLGFHVELKMDEALSYAQKRIEELQSELQRLETQTKELQRNIQLHFEDIARWVDQYQSLTSQ